MILEYGDVSQLAGQRWNIVELRSERNSEETIKRIGREVPKIFREDPVEIFIPIAGRGLDDFRLKTESYIFVRSVNPRRILELRKITGVVWCVCEGNGSNVNRLIYLEDDYIQKVVAENLTEFNSRIDGVVVGSFVRLVDGYTRDFCGHVVHVINDMAYIQIRLKTNDVLVETPVKNLCLLHPKYEETKVFFYSPPLEEYVEDGGIVEDVSLVEGPEEVMEGDVVAKGRVSPPPSGERKRFNKQQTVTAYTNNLVSAGTTKPLEIANRLIEGVRTGTLKPPKNLVIVCGVIKYAVTAHIRKIDDRVSNYRDLVRFYGNEYFITPAILSRLAPEMSLKTTPENVRKRRKPGSQVDQTGAVYGSVREAHDDLSTITVK